MSFRCDASVIFSNGTDWYPQTMIGDCCSLKYDSNLTDFKEKLEEMYDFTDGNATTALKNIFMDTLEGIISDLTVEYEFNAKIIIYIITYNNLQ